MIQADEFTKDMLTKLLHDNIVEVDYKKKNGEDRKMICTLREDKINYESKGSGRVVPEDLIVVWDVENDDWRSMLVENIKSYIAVSEKNK